MAVLSILKDVVYSAFSFRNTMLYYTQVVFYTGKYVKMIASVTFLAQRNQFLRKRQNNEHYNSK